MNIISILGGIYMKKVRFLESKKQNLKVNG